MAALTGFSITGESGKEYRVGPILGRGVFGLVYEALSGFDRYAFKIPTKREGVLSVESFNRELCALQAIEKSGPDARVVRLYDFAKEPVEALIMQYVSGPTIREKQDLFGPFELSVA